MGNQRINDSFLAARERAFLMALVRRVPDSVNPDQLTGLGLTGAIAVLFGFIACRWSNGFLVVVILGLALN
ncbi:MAG: hypothetical protein N2444_09200, partial [Methylocystis sp.]|nr:hypothetical protein [Methylocystis sp.]